jgi:hypothetical protein
MVCVWAAALSVASLLRELPKATYPDKKPRKRDYRHPPLE